MTHSVESHLSVLAATYDIEIRRFVPAYETMLDEAMDAIGRQIEGQPASHLLDIGAGTGRLTATAAAHFPKARFTLVDIDTTMLEESKRRLANESQRATFVGGSFFEPLPSCDVAMASLSLHHVHDPERKKQVYANIRSCIAPGGALVVCDAMVPKDKALLGRTMKRWSEHLVRGGDTETEAFGRFTQWAEEDRYFSIEEELGFMKDAGFKPVELVWRNGPLAVIVAIK